MDSGGGPWGGENVDTRFHQFIMALVADAVDAEHEISIPTMNALLHQWDECKKVCGC